MKTYILRLIYALVGKTYSFNPKLNISNSFDPNDRGCYSGYGTITRQAI